MGFRDFCIYESAESAGQIREFAKALGFSDMAFFSHELKEEAHMLADVKSRADMKALPAGMKIVAVCYSAETARLAIEKGVAAIIPPWRERHAGMNFVAAKLAAGNRVSIFFPFSELLHSAGHERLSTLAGMR